MSDPRADFETVPVGTMAELARLRKALPACKGYLLNALIDLETGAPKTTAAATLRGGIRMVDDALLTEIAALG